MYIASRRSYPKLFRITDKDNLMPIIRSFMTIGFQVDIVCSQTAIGDIELLEDNDFLENYKTLL